MQKKNYNAQDLLGNAIPNAAASVYLKGTSTLATIYSDNGITPATNPLTTDANGMFSFYVADGRYDIQAVKAGYTTQNWKDELFFDPNASTGSAYVSFVQSGTGAVAESVALALQHLGRSVTGFGASTAASAATNSASFQAAHDAAVAGGFTSVYFPAGVYNFTTLNWSPYIQAKAIGGPVFLLTANASGRTIQISDEYGQQLISGTGYTRNVVWDGPFILINTNGANTAIAWSFGGATNTRACNLCTPLREVETRGFGGGVYEFRHNAFILEFHSCFAKNNLGNVLVIPSGTVNTGESLKFIGGASGGTTGGTPMAGYLLDINTASSMSIDFVSHSADYLSGFNKTGNTNALVKINWLHGNIEWDEVARTYIQNDGGMEINIDGAKIVEAAAAGIPTPSISDTSNTSTTRIVNTKYEVHNTSTLHRATGANARLFLDELPNFQGASSPATFVTYASSAVGQTINPQRDPATGWGIDFAQRGTKAIAGGGTFNLPTGSGLVILHDNTTGNQGFYRMAAGTVYTISVDTPFVAGAAGVNQIGLAWTGAVYQISNGYAASHDLYITLLKTRASA